MPPVEAEAVAHRRGDPSGILLPAPATRPNRWWEGSLNIDTIHVDQPESHAWNVAEPRWGSRFRSGGPGNWPDTGQWEEGFDMTEADEVYAEVNPYADPK
ncbi:hypothetical protein ACFOY4_30770 [Actinomadura syzygii]|uniref:Uncharacterized protein n=1 Tax=Actinomadura syzygii TaxID=1427538 RepID=A0A5D0TRD0_9ACTN|nr:hypothetical protein [Actinomadura syzygii]TYC08708.1 hypothetical protein FXF65_38175 [Actinomadura syzygii]